MIKLAEETEPEWWTGELNGERGLFPVSYVEDAGIFHALLHKEPSQRLGANGMDEIKSHAFFRGVDWAAVERQEVRPPMRPRTVGGEDQVEAAALMARIRSDFKPYTSPVHSPTAGAPTMGRSPLCNRVSTRFDSPKHDTSPQ